MNITDFNYRIAEDNHSRLNVVSPISFGKYLAGKGVGFDCKISLSSLMKNQQDLVLAIYDIDNVVGVFLEGSRIIIFKSHHIAWDGITEHLGLVLREWIDANIAPTDSEK